MNVAELGDSEGARRRIDAVRGEKVLVRVKRCGNGFNTFEEIGWLTDGTKLVGRSYLVKRQSDASTQVDGCGRYPTLYT